MNPNQLKNMLTEFKVYGTSNRMDFTSLLPVLEQRAALRNIHFNRQSALKKTDLRNALTGAKSFIALGFPYPLLLPKLKHHTASGYSTITDYHAVLVRSLKKLTNNLQALNPDNRFICFTDSGLAYEKELAREAKLGFMGRNGLVINSTYGSFMFLGFVLTDLELPPLYSHAQVPAQACGSCRRCMNTCPNSALDEHGLDVKKCISYQTQSPEKPSLHNHLWGCDLCQIVCPYNLHRKMDIPPLFSYRFSTDLLKKDLTAAEFNQLSAELPIQWKGHANWMKNFENCQTLE